MFSYLRQPRGFYRRLFLLALPIIVQNLITTSLGFLDTFMVGLLGSEQMSAVTVANVPIFIIQLIVFGLQSGSSVLISQYWGRGDRESINRVIGIGLCIAGSVSTLFALIMAFFPADVLLLVTDNLRLVAIGTPYIRIVGFSYILNSLSSIYIGMQRSIENPRFGMLVFGASMLCNTVGNYVLIFGKLGFPALGVTGAAALATSIARLLEMGLILFVVFGRKNKIAGKLSEFFSYGKDLAKRIYRNALPTTANETLWGVGYSLITVIMGHMAASGDLIAAYTVAGSIDKLSTAGIYGIANAAAVIVGKVELDARHAAKLRLECVVHVVPVLMVLLQKLLKIRLILHDHAAHAQLGQLRADVVDLVAAGGDGHFNPLHKRCSFVRDLLPL